MSKPLPYRIVSEKDSLHVMDMEGKTVATVPAARKKLAKQIADLPVILWALDRLLDGTDGYISEVGDCRRYWEQHTVWEAHRLLGKP